MLLGWEPVVPLREGLDRVVALRAHQPTPCADRTWLTTSSGVSGPGDAGRTAPEAEATAGARSAEPHRRDRPRPQVELHLHVRQRRAADRRHGRARPPAHAERLRPGGHGGRLPALRPVLRADGRRPGRGAAARAQRARRAQRVHLVAARRRGLLRRCSWPWRRWPRCSSRDTPGVVAVTRVMSLTFVIGGLTAVTQGLLRRRFAFQRHRPDRDRHLRARLRPGGPDARRSWGSAPGVSSPRHLVAGALAAAIYLVLCRRDIGFGLPVGSLKSIYSFGGRVSLIGFGEFIGSNLDTLWAGHFLGSAATGLYTRATNLANVPLYYLTTSLSRVLMPAYSRIQSERERLEVGLPDDHHRGRRHRHADLVGRRGRRPRGHRRRCSGGQWLARRAGAGRSGTRRALHPPHHFGAILCEATATLNVKIAITVGRIGWLAALFVVSGALRHRRHRHGVRTLGARPPTSPTCW